MKKRYHYSLPGMSSHPMTQMLTQYFAGVVRVTVSGQEWPLELELQLLSDLADQSKTPLVSKKTRDAATLLLSKIEKP